MTSTKTILLTSLIQVQIEIKTFTHMSLVGVTGFSVNTTILDDVLEGIVHQTSTAALVTLWTYSNQKNSIADV
jgi:hypothetical protein